MRIDHRADEIDALCLGSVRDLRSHALRGSQAARQNPFDWQQERIGQAPLQLRRQRRAGDALCCAFARTKPGQRTACGSGFSGCNRCGLPGKRT
jgi:hypothetical protein